MSAGLKRLSGAIVLGTCVTLGACGRHNDNANDTATAGGDVAMSDTGTAARTDTGAVYNGAGGAMTDANIMAQITTANTSEIQQGKLAEQKATNPQVKQFARMMVTDHTAMNKQGHEVAKKDSLVTQSGDKAKDMNEDATDATKDLQGKSGADFDKAYMDAQVDAHQKTLDMLNDARKNAKNADVTSLIDAAIPKVQSHLDRAKQIQQSLNK